MTEPTRATGLSAADFQKTFQDEGSCAVYLFRLRWTDGFVCPNCHGNRAALLKSRAFTYDCLNCGRQTSITADTVMHRSRLPLQTWFSAAHLIATRPGGVSARQIQERLGIPYQTAWTLKKKLELPKIGAEDEPLQGHVEIGQTEILFQARSPIIQSVLTRTIVVVGAFEMPNNGTGEAKPSSISARVALVSDNSPASMEDFIRANVRQGSILLRYGDKPEFQITGYSYVSCKYGMTLSRSRQAFSALKDWFRAQTDLDDGLVEKGLKQFGAELNWRISFDAVLRLAMSNEPRSYWDIVGRDNPRRGIPTTRRRPRRRKTVTGMREDGSGRG